MDVNSDYGRSPGWRVITAIQPSHSLWGQWYSRMAARRLQLRGQRWLGVPWDAPTSLLAQDIALLEDRNAIHSSPVALAVSRLRDEENGFCGSRRWSAVVLPGRPCESEPLPDQAQIERLTHMVGQPVEPLVALTRGKRIAVGRRQPARRAGRIEKGMAEGIVVEESVDVGANGAAVLADNTIQQFGWRPFPLNRSEGLASLGIHRLSKVDLVSGKWRLNG